MSKRMHPLNGQVGARVRDRRISQGLSQRQLADAIGVTFQQIQKYENGTNRIDVARLAALAEALGVPLQWFFQQASAEVLQPFRIELALEEELGGRQILTLVRGFRGIADPAVRAGVVELVQAMSATTLRRKAAKVELDARAAAC